MHSVYSESSSPSGRSLLDVIKQIHETIPDVLAYAFPPDFKDLPDDSATPVVVATDQVYAVLLNLQALTIINIIHKKDDTTL